MILSANVCPIPGVRRSQPSAKLPLPPRCVRSPDLASYEELAYLIGALKRSVEELDISTEIAGRAARGSSWDVWN